MNGMYVTCRDKRQMYTKNVAISACAHSICLCKEHNKRSMCVPYLVDSNFLEGVLKQLEIRDIFVFQPRCKLHSF